MLELAQVRLRSSAQSGFTHSFAPGEITVVLGANLSGKTDLCRLIAGLNTRASGRVLLDGDEAQHGTDPLSADTDGGGVDDGDEIVAGTDPLLEK